MCPEHSAHKHHFCPDPIITETSVRFPPAKEIVPPRTHRLPPCILLCDFVECVANIHEPFDTYVISLKMVKDAMGRVRCSNVARLYRLNVLQTPHIQCLQAWCHTLR